MAKSFEANLCKVSSLEDILVDSEEYFEGNTDGYGRFLWAICDEAQGNKSLNKILLETGISGAVVKRALIEQAKETIEAAEYDIKALEMGVKLDFQSLVPEWDVPDAVVEASEADQEPKNPVLSVAASVAKDLALLTAQSLRDKPEEGDIIFVEATRGITALKLMVDRFETKPEKVMNSLQVALQSFPDVDKEVGMPCTDQVRDKFVSNGYVERKTSIIQEFLAVLPRNRPKRYSISDPEVRNNMKTVTGFAGTVGDLRIPTRVVYLREYLGLEDDGQSSPKSSLSSTGTPTSTLSAESACAVLEELQR